MPECLFCKIAAKEIPARLVHEDADTVAFEDLNPQAPTHVLVVPRKHLATLNDLGPQDEPLVGKLFRVAARIAHDRGHAGPGWEVGAQVGREREDRRDDVRRLETVQLLDREDELRDRLADGLGRVRVDRDRSADGAHGSRPV